MKFTLYTANCTGNEKNCLYPNVCIIENEADFAAAVERDHVTGRFRGNYRSIDNFEVSDCEVMDCDNDHSEDPAEWITPEILTERLDDIAFATAPSRNNMKVKEGRSERPRFHIYFPHGQIRNAKECAALKHRIHDRMPFFDENALDAARFIFGSPAEKVTWHEGEMNIDVWLTPQSKSIPQGQRNSTMSRFAGKVVTRYGATDRAHEIFLEQAAKCDPPLDDEELDGIWHSACKFAKKVQSQEGYIPPEEYEFQNQSLKPDDYSDIGQAKILAREYGHELKYSAATDYVRYDGSCWVESKQRAVGAMEEFLDLQLEDAKDELDRALKDLMSAGVAESDIRSGGKALEKKIEADQMKAYLVYMSALAYKSFVMKRRDMKYVTSALAAAKPMLEIQPSDLDADPYLLNCPDGTYDLNLGLAGRKDHDAADLITKMTAYAPGDEGKDLWLDSLDLTFRGDQELIDYVQQITGIGAIGMVNLEAMIISYGEGSNGKSTFWNSIAGALGTYSGNISADTLTVGCRRNVKPELAEAKGKRLLIAAEMEEGMRLNTSTVKQLCSTDEIFAEKKYKDPFSFTPSHTLVLYTNHLPRVGAMDAGIWRRLIVIPFTARITGSSDKKNYGEFLLKNAGPYIVSWIIEGAKKAIEADFRIPLPKVVREAIESYRSDNDWLGHFIDECCELDDTFQEKSGELYQAYRAYCSRTGEYVRSTTDFYNALDSLGVERKKTMYGVMAKGIRLNTEESTDVPF